MRSSGYWRCAAGSAEASRFCSAEGIAGLLGARDSAAVGPRRDIDLVPLGRLPVGHRRGDDRGAPGQDHMDWAGIRERLARIDDHCMVGIGSFANSPPTATPSAIAADRSPPSFTNAPPTALRTAGSTWPQRRSGLAGP